MEKKEKVKEEGRDKMGFQQLECCGQGWSALKPESDSWEDPSHLAWPVLPTGSFSVLLKSSPFGE